MGQATNLCSYCGGGVGENALYCPKCLVPIALPVRRRQPSTAALLLGVSLIFGSPCAWVIAGQLRSQIEKVGATRAVVHAAPVEQAPAVDQAEALIARCGAPERDFSTANSDPRPPIPFRVLEYAGKHLQFDFVPGGGAKIGDPPPYVWALSGILDTTTNQRVPLAAAAARMGCAASALSPAGQTAGPASLADSAASAARNR